MSVYIQKKVIIMDLHKLIKKNPLCLMSVNTTLNMYDSRLVLPVDTVLKLTEQK